MTTTLFWLLPISTKGHNSKKRNVVMVGPLCPLKSVCINDANKVNNRRKYLDIDAKAQKQSCFKCVLDICIDYNRR